MTVKQLILVLSMQFELGAMYYSKKYQLLLLKIKKGNFYCTYLTMWFPYDWQLTHFDTIPW